MTTQTLPVKNILEKKILVTFARILASLMHNFLTSNRLDLPASGTSTLYFTLRLHTLRSG